MHKIYVYGTLRQGGALHRYMRGNAPLATLSLPGFKMYSLGMFPGIIASENQEDKIIVEEYQISDQVLEILDRIEGNPDYFHRTIVGDHYIYTFPNIIQENKVIKSGDWFNQ